MRAARRIVVGGMLIAAIAADAWGLWAAPKPAAAGQTAPSGGYSVAAAQQGGMAQVAPAVQAPGLDSMAAKKRRRHG